MGEVDRANTAVWRSGCVGAQGSPTPGRSAGGMHSDPSASEPNHIGVRWDARTAARRRNAGRRPSDRRRLNLTNRLAATKSAVDVIPAVRADGRQGRGQVRPTGGPLVVSGYVVEVADGQAPAVVARDPAEDDGHSAHTRTGGEHVADLRVGRPSRLVGLPTHGGSLPGVQREHGPTPRPDNECLLEQFADRRTVIIARGNAPTDIVNIRITDYTLHTSPGLRRGCSADVSSCCPVWSPVNTSSAPGGQSGAESFTRRSHRTRDNRVPGSPPRTATRPARMSTLVRQASPTPSLTALPVDLRIPCSPTCTRSSP